MAGIDLRRLRIATPCDAAEDDLVRGERSARCRLCERDVVRVSRHTRAEIVAMAEAARERGERLCGEIEVRTVDGAVRFADGHVARADLGKKRLPMLAGTAAVALAACGQPEPSVPALVAPPPPALVAPSPPPPVSPLVVASPEPAPSPEPEPEPEVPSVVAPAQVPVVAPPVSAKGKPAPPKKKTHELMKGDMEL